MNIYCIDDQQATLCLYRAQFDRYGHVFIFQHADDLLQAISISVPDVVICDLVMPEVDGWTVTDKVREIAPDVKIIIATAMEDPAMEALAELKGYGFWNKFDKWNKLKEMIQCPTTYNP